MTKRIALACAIDVGGIGKLAMPDFARSSHREGDPFDVRFPADGGLRATQLTRYHGCLAPARQSFQLPQVGRRPALPLASLLLTLLFSTDH
jgi:hypothetical protein